MYKEDLKSKTKKKYQNGCAGIRDDEDGGKDGKKRGNKIVAANISI